MGVSRVTCHVSLAADLIGAHAMQIEIVLILRDTGSRYQKIISRMLPAAARWRCGALAAAPDRAAWTGLWGSGAWGRLSALTSLCLSLALCIKKKLKLNAPNKLNVHQITFAPTKWDHCTYADLQRSDCCRALRRASLSGLRPVACGASAWLVFARSLAVAFFTVAFACVACTAPSQPLTSVAIRDCEEAGGGGGGAFFQKMPVERPGSSGERGAVITAAE